MEWLQTSLWRLLGRSRWLVVLAVGLLFSTFASTFFNSTPVSAADATWNNRDLVYKNETYTRTTDSTKIKNIGIPDGSLVYISEKSGGSVGVIYFPTTGDLTSLTSATHAVYSFTPPRTYNKQSSATISIEPPSSNSSATVSCDVQGLGWIICPLANHLAGFMDWVYGMLMGFLKTQPLATSNQDSGVYIAWNIMRSFANAAFVVAFLVIVYSQITSIGISNYGIKKMLPRLIIASTLVNMSYVISAIAVDLSNVLGYTLQDMLINIKNTVVTLGTTTNAPLTWTEITTTVLSGGAALSGAVYAVALGSELVPFLVSVLVSMGLIALLVLVIMAARQALIIILVIISPLAFVCYLLPGTEQWFKKWTSTFFTMMIFFPAFSLVFGGAQLAGLIIIQNATGENGAVMHILGMAVQIAPLALTPLILKLGGGILNRVAGIVNDKNKGILDRTNNWARERSEITKHRKLTERRGKRYALTNARRHMDHKARLRKQRLEDYQKKAQTGYEDSKMGRKQALFSKQVADEASLVAAQNDNIYDEAKTGNYPADVASRGFMERQLRKVSSRYAASQDSKLKERQDALQKLTQDIAVEGLRKSNNQRELNKRLADAIIGDKSLQDRAAGVYKHGVDAALASALSTSRSDEAKSVEEAGQILKHFNLSSEQRQALALGKSIKFTDDNGQERVFDGTESVYIREAAITEQMKIGTAREVAEIISKTGPEFRGTVAAGLVASGMKTKAPFLAGKLIDDIAKGDINSEDDLYNYIASWIEGGKFKVDDIAATDADGATILQQMLLSSHGQKISADARQEFKKHIEAALTDPELSRGIAKLSQEKLRQLQQML